MKYAVIRTGGKQYRVSEGDLVKVEKLAGEVGEKVTLPDVLFVGGNDDVKIGSPLVGGATVTAEVLGPSKGPKVTIVKYRRRKGYRRKVGHRQHYTTVKITDISV